METIINVMSNLEDMRFIKPATQLQIDQAEKDLDLEFADDYKEYLLTYGVISARGIELTGLSTVKRLDVVDVTKRERELISNMPSDVYVIENTAIDGVLVVQKRNGNVYSISMNGQMTQLCNSLTEYVLHSNF